MSTYKWLPYKWCDTPLVFPDGKLPRWEPLRITLRLYDDDNSGDDDDQRLTEGGYGIIDTRNFGDAINGKS